MFCAIPPQANKFGIFEICVISVKKPLCFSVPRFLCVEKLSMAPEIPSAIRSIPCLGMTNPMERVILSLCMVLVRREGERISVLEILPEQMLCHQSE